VVTRVERDGGEPGREVAHTSFDRNPRDQRTGLTVSATGNRKTELPRLENKIRRAWSLILRDTRVDPGQKIVKARLAQIVLGRVSDAGLKRIDETSSCGIVGLQVNLDVPEDNAETIACVLGYLGDIVGFLCLGSGGVWVE
jgi:hypothetical protein